MHVSDEDDENGFTTPSGLSTPVTAFVHGKIEDELKLRDRYRRVYICRQFVRPVVMTRAVYEAEDARRRRARHCRW